MHLGKLLGLPLPMKMVCIVIIMIQEEMKLVVIYSTIWEMPTLTLTDALLEQGWLILDPAVYLSSEDIQYS